MKKCIFFVLVALSVLLTASAQAQHKIQAEGMSAIHKNFVDIARTKAIDEAQRNAIERVVGVKISSATRTENYQVMFDTIMSESNGYLNAYRVISEERQGNQYKVVIEADVGIDKLLDRIDAIRAVMDRKSKPRVMVVFNRGHKRDVIAESTVTKFLIDQGFKLVDSESVAKGLEGKLPAGTAAVDSKTAMSIGHKYGAEAVLLGVVECTTSDFIINNVKMRFNKVSHSAKVMKSDTGEVIASDSVSDSGPGMDDVVKAINERNSEKLARRLTEQIISKWSAELNNQMTVKLLISNMKSYQDLALFKEKLILEAKGVKQVHQRYYKQGMAEMDIEISGTTQGLADDIGAIKLGPTKIQITGITQNKIEAGLIP